MCVTMYFSNVRWDAGIIEINFYLDKSSFRIKPFATPKIVNIGLRTYHWLRVLRVTPPSLVKTWTCSCLVSLLFLAAFTLIYKETIHDRLNFNSEEKD